MNLLTQSLLKELLGEQKTVAIYGGGFKPPTKGHFHVAELVLEQLPEIDELKIFVGQGVRDGITQDESIRIWDIYKNYLSPKVDVEPSVAPVKSVLGYAKENPDTKVYWILGARDGDEGDLADIENRTRTLSKYPNLEVKVITTSGGVSGTKTRQAIRDNNKEQFLHMIPDVNDTEKEEIWDMVHPVIKEGFIDEVKTKFQKFIAAIKQEGQETKEVVGLLFHAAKGEIKLTDEQKEYIGNQLKDVLKLVGLTAIAVLPGGSIAAVLLKVFKAEHLVTPSSFVNEVGEANLQPYKWEEVDREGYYVYTRFTTDSETQYDVDLKTTNYIDDDLNNLRALEIEFTAKPKGAEGSSAKIVVNKGEMYRVMSTIVDIVKKYIKKSKSQAILYSPSKKSDEEDFGTQRDNLYKAFISKAFPGVKFKQDGEIVAAILPDIINELVTDTEVICDNCGWEWPIADGGDDLYICHKCGHDNNPDLEEGTCGYDTDVKTGEKLDTPGGLEEGKQVGTLYHYTSVDGLKGILSSNSIKASEEIYMGQNLYYISFTRNKNFHKKGSKFGVKTEYRITLDGDKLSNKYKITPHAYKPGYDYTENWEYDWLEDEPENVVRDFFAATGEYDEQEERISFKGPEGGIDNIKNYILSVDKVEDLQENLISETMTVYRLGEIPYDEESFFVTPDYKTWIKFYPGEEIHKITTNKLYLPLRSKSFLSWDELRSKYNSGEFTDDDVSYINPEESGIQDFEQYEIKPDDIIDLEQINLEEGRKKKPDPKKGTGKKPEGSSRRLYTDEDPKDTVKIKFKTKEDIVDTLNKESFKAKSHARQSQIINVIHQRVRAAYSKAKDSEVKSRLKRALDYIEKRKEMSKKKTERLNKMKEASDPQAGTALPYGSGFTPVKEDKQEVKDSMVVVLSRKDNQINLYDLKTNEALGVINTYGNEVTGVAAKKGYGPLMYELGMANVYPNGLQSDRHGNTEPAAENIWKKYIAGASPNIKVQKLTPKDKDYRTTYAGDGYDSSYISDFYNYKFYNSNTSTLKQLIQKGNTLSDELKKQIVLDSDKLYSNMVRESNSKDPFGLNELAKDFVKEVFNKAWNFQEGMLSLSRYMIDNGMNIKPLPKIKVIKDDEENASNLLGKTAYYNPNEKSITLYTMNRHPKDILRSFAHEMIHHEQNLNGKLNNITTQNTNEDGDLPEIEKEAYEKGNMMLRNWEDSIKNV